MKTPAGQGTMLLALWLPVVVCSLLLRPLFPVDETRYLSVAWEMWQRQDFLLPWLNGEPYSHKPPLLFWLVHLVWSVTGVQAWSARLIAPVLALISLYLTRRLAVALWPEGGEAVGRYAVWLTFASLFWLLFMPLVQFDLLLVDCVLLAWLGLSAARSGAAAGWLLTGVGIGLGVLGKGPVVLVFVLPPLLLAPLWLTGDDRLHLVRWYAGGILSVLLGAAIALAWAIPAGLAGGADYREAIFWGQSAGRVVHAFAHRSPWWSYAWMLPLLCLPWLLWPRLWVALIGAGKREWTCGGRFVGLTVAVALLVLSLVSGKQVKYLLPLLPLIALGIARTLVDADAGERASDRWFVTGLPVAAGGSILALPAFAGHAAWSTAVSPAWALLLFAGAGGIGFARPSGLESTLRWLAISLAAVVIVAHLAVAPAARAAFDLTPISSMIAALQENKVSVAYLGNYHGQFQFLGRLQQPVVELNDGRSRADWVAAHPDGYLVEYRRAGDGAGPGDLYSQPWRNGRLVLWPAARFGQAE